MTKLTEFLASTEIINWQEPEVIRLAAELSQNVDGELAIARTSFEWVRDNIQHCLDFNRNEVTCVASEVLRIGTGFCYAKSHLLAALLRANRIPTGFCYQRLSLRGNGAPYCLHGLNAVYLTDVGWYRIDARGNSDTVNAEFDPPHERLAFLTDDPGEADLPEVWPAPLPMVVEALRAGHSVDELMAMLPDVPVIGCE